MEKTDNIEVYISCYFAAILSTVCKFVRHFIPQPRFHAQSVRLIPPPSPRKASVWVTKLATRFFLLFEVFLILLDQLLAFSTNLPRELYFLHMLLDYLFAVLVQSSYHAFVDTITKGHSHSNESGFALTSQPTATASYKLYSEIFPNLSTFLVCSCCTNCYSQYVAAIVEPDVELQSLFDSQAHVIQELKYCTIKCETFRFALPDGNLFTQENESRS